MNSGPKVKRVWLLWFSDCAALLVRVHSNPSSKRRKRRKKNRSSCSCELHMVAMAGRVCCSFICENFKRSERVQADCGIWCLCPVSAVNPHSIGLFVKKCFQVWCLVLRTLPFLRTSNRNTKPNHQWSKVACHCISPLQSSIYCSTCRMIRTTWRSPYEHMKKHANIICANKA